MSIVQISYPDCELNVYNGNMPQSSKINSIEVSVTNGTNASVLRSNQLQITDGVNSMELSQTQGLNINGTIGSAGQVLQKSNPANVMEWGAPPFCPLATGDFNMNSNDINNIASLNAISSTDLNIKGQAVFDTPPHIPDPILGNDAASKGYVDTLIGNYSGNGLTLYFNYEVAQTDPIIAPSVGILHQTLTSINSPTTGNFYKMRSVAAGTNTLISTFKTDVGFPNTLTIPSGLWSMLIWGYTTNQNGQLYYHFHLNEVDSAGDFVAQIATSGFSSDVNAISLEDPDAFHCSLAIVNGHTMASVNSRLQIQIYTTGTSPSSTMLYTLFGGDYYSNVTTTLNGATSLLTQNNTWTGVNDFTAGFNTTAVDSTTTLALGTGTATTTTLGRSGGTTIIQGNTINLTGDVNVSNKLTLASGTLTVYGGTSFAKADGTANVILESSYPNPNTTFIMSLGGAGGKILTLPPSKNGYSITLMYNYTDSTTTNWTIQTSNSEKIYGSLGLNGGTSFSLYANKSVTLYQVNNSYYVTSETVSFSNISARNSTLNSYSLTGTNSYVFSTASSYTVSNFYGTLPSMFYRMSGQTTATFNLPASPTQGFTLMIRNANTGNLTVASSSAVFYLSSASPVTSFILAANKSVTLVTAHNVGYYVTATQDWVGTATSDLVMGSNAITGTSMDSATTLTLGGTNATDVTVGRSGATTTTISGTTIKLTGNIKATNIDTATATTLALGNTTTNNITIGRSGLATVAITATTINFTATTINLTNARLYANYSSLNVISANGATATVSLWDNLTNTTGGSASILPVNTNGVVYLITASTRTAATNMLTSTSNNTFTLGGRSLLTGMTFNLEGVAANFNSTVNNIATLRATTIDSITSGMLSIGSNVLTTGINFNNKAVSGITSIDSAGTLSLGGTTATGVNVGRANQTTNLIGNVKINESSGTEGQVLTSTGETTSPTWQTPASSTFVGTADKALAMSDFAITGATTIDSAGTLSLGTTSLGTTIGTSAQTTNIKGNVQINESSGTEGQVLTSTGETTSPTWQTPASSTFVGTLP
jgi:hypothetical protein